ncbi:MAG: formyltransferase family protein [Vicingaceae bacterium]
MTNNISLFVLGYKGLVVLKKLLEHNYEEAIEAVIVGEDRNVENDYSKEVTQLLEASNIQYFKRKADYKLKSKYWIAIGWRWLIQESPPSKLIVLHDSLLPKYRGFSPLVNQLINGEREVGVSAIFAVEEYDKGPILEQQSKKINYPIKINTAIQLVSDLYAKVVLSLIKKISLDKELIGKVQDEAKATYSLWRDELDYFIDWSSNSKKISRTINALGFPYHGAKTYFNNKLVVINEAEVYPDLEIENRHCGKVVKIEQGKPVVVCKKGLLKITKAHDIESKTSILPLQKFRSRFHS